MNARLTFPLLVCLLLVFETAFAQPRITFDATTVDLGTIPQRSPGMFEYPFTNTGDSILIISTVKSSCGCVSPSFDYQPVKPEERGVVRARYDTNRLGPCNKTLTVVCNDPSQSILVLYLKCNVYAAEPSLEFSALDVTKPSFTTEELGKSKLEGGDECRPCIPPQSVGPYVMLVTNPNSQIAWIDLAAYNDPANDHFGVFLSKELPSAPSKEQISQGWATQYTDNGSLFQGQNIYMIVNDAEWLRETIFKDDVNVWAIPLGVTWRVDQRK